MFLGDSSPSCALQIHILIVWSLNLFFGLLASAIFLTILLLLPCLIVAPSVQVVFPCTPLTVKFFRNVSLHKNAKKSCKTRRQVTQPLNPRITPFVIEAYRVRKCVKRHHQILKVMSNKIMFYYGKSCLEHDSYCRL